MILNKIIIKSSIFSKKILGGVLACLLLTSANVSAEEKKIILAGDVKLSTPVYKPTFQPALGIYEYDVSWQGIPAANVKVGVEKKDKHYEIWTRVSTNSFVDVFYTLRYRASALLTKAEFAPIQSNFYQKENSRIKKTTLKFLSNGEIHSVRINSDGDKEKYSFNPNNFTLDPFSAAFIARGLDWTKGVVNQFDAFNGKSRYLITMKVAHTEERKINGIKKKLWVIEPKVKNLTNPNQSKLRQAYIYLTADELRDIVEIKSEVFIGSVRTKLQNFKPLPEKTLGTVVAANFEKD
jgi:hypothetical protein